jgi:hypothetical protein
MGSNISHLQTAVASDFAYRHVCGAAFFKMAMITIILPPDFAIMGPMWLHRAKGAQFQRQGLEALLYIDRQLRVILHCPFIKAHFPPHMQLNVSFFETEGK